MEEHIKTLQSQIDAIDAIKNSDEVKARIAAVDDGIGRFIGPALGVFWTIIVSGAMIAGFLGIRFLDGSFELAALAIAGLVPLLTGILSKCPIYAMFNIKTTD